MDIIDIVLSKKYTDESLKGVTGTLAGKNCTIKSATKADGVTTVVFAWTADDGTEKTTTIQVNDGTNDYEDLINRPKIEGVDLIGNKTFEDLGAASATDLAQTDGHLQDLADLVGDKANLPMPNETVVNNIEYVDTKADKLIDDLGDLDKILNVRHLRITSVTTTGSYVRANAFSGLSLIGGRSYTFTVKPVSVTTNEYYLYFVDASGVETVINDKTDRITYNFTPTENMNNVSIKVSSGASSEQTFECSWIENVGDNEIDKLNTSLCNILVTNIDAEFTIKDNYVDKNNGELTSDITYESTDFIEIPALATGLKFDVTFKDPRSGEYNAFYDKNKKFISNFSYGEQITGIQEAHISENAKYFRLSKHKTGVIINTITAMYDKKIADTVSELGGTVSKLEEKLPSYLNDEFDSTLNTVSEIIQNKNNLTVIGVMTDLHFSSAGSGFYENDLRTGVFNAAKALAEMTTKIPFDIVAFLGDYMQLPNKDSGQTKEMGISNLMDVNRMLSKMNAPTMAISGNHEGNYTGDGTGYGLSDSEIYNYLLKKSILTNKAVRHNNDYYVDDTASLTRHVFIDGRVVTENENTKNWLKNVVSSNLPDGYSIIVYSHYSMDSESVLTYVKDYIDAIIQGGHTPILWIGGHWHADRHDTYNGCLVVSLLQSGLWSSEPSEDGTTYKHNVGTATESAFTVFILDRDNKKVNLIRFGLGNDYEYTLS